MTILYDFFISRQLARKAALCNEEYSGEIDCQCIKGSFESTYTGSQTE